MPYTDDASRAKVATALTNGLTYEDLREWTHGDLTFALTFIAAGYMAAEDPSYTRYSQALASLRDSEAELRRRIVDPYENFKRHQNEDVGPVADALQQVINKVEVWAKTRAENADPEQTLLGAVAEVPENG